MCPLCIGTATLLLSGGTSAGGFAALLVSRSARKKHRRVRAARQGIAPVANQAKDGVRRSIGDIMSNSSLD
jgi:hypothetical protein